MAKVTPLNTGFRPATFVPPHLSTCDAGDCDEDTAALVFDEDKNQWISMCSTHTVHELGGYTQTDVEDNADD